MKSGCCIFSDEMKCTKFYCRGCKSVPDLQKTEFGKHSLEYIMRIAISDSRKKNEQAIKCKNDIKDCPEWINRISEDNKGLIPGGDHVEIFEKNGDFVITSEPYHMSMGEIKELTEFCDKRDLTFRMDGVSSHNPGHTFRIYIYNKGGNEAMGKLITNYGQ